MVKYGEMLDPHTQPKIASEWVRYNKIWYRTEKSLDFTEQAQVLKTSFTLMRRERVGYSSCLSKLTLSASRPLST